jgi:hypothetical protein
VGQIKIRKDFLHSSNTQVILAPNEKLPLGNKLNFKQNGHGILQKIFWQSLY